MLENEKAGSALANRRGLWYKPICIIDERGVAAARCGKMSPWYVYVLLVAGNSEEARLVP